MNLAKNLLDEFAVPLEIISHADEIRGKVRLQKLIFLSQTYLEDKYDFVAAPLGPLSDRVNYLLRRMTEFGFVEESIKPTPSSNVVYCYKITNDGEKILKHIRKSKVLSQKEIEKINSIYKKYGEMPYIKLLDFVHKKYPEYHLKEIRL